MERYVRPSGPDERERVLGAIARGRADPPEGEQLIVRLDGQDVGAVSWEPFVVRHRIAGVHGLMVDPGRRGRGVGEAALGALVARLLDRLGLHRVQAECYAYNVAGQRTFERAGFTREGIRRQAWRRDEAWVDGVLYGLVAEDRAGWPPEDRRP